MMKVELREGYKIVKAIEGEERTSAIYRQGEWGRKYRVGQLTHRHPRHGALTVFEELKHAESFLGIKAFTAAIKSEHNVWSYEIWECLYSPSIYGAFFVGEKGGVFRLLDVPIGTDYAETIMITERVCK